MSHTESMRIGCGAAALLVAALSSAPHAATRGLQEPEGAGADLLDATLTRYCVTCHSDRLRTADLSLAGLDLSHVGEQAEVWEKVIAKLRTRQMPPVGRPRPERETYDALAGWLESEIDRVALANPNPGRTEAVHRLNRSEYANAIRGLLALDVDVDALLPADDFDEYGFDNMADVLTVSPALMERYLSAARKIGRLAVGETPFGPGTETYKVPILLLQDDRMGDDLPFGSRGGLGIRHHFPVDGEYDLEIRLHRNYVNYVRGMGFRHELQVRLDGALVRTFTFGAEEPAVVQAPASYGGNQFGDPEWEEYMLFADANLRVRFEAEAGPHVVGVSFVRKLTEPEGVLQPRQSVFAVAVNEMRNGNAAVEHVAIGGPYVSTGPGDTPSRRAIFVCNPGPETDTASASGEEACAREILGSLARRAYRRPVDTGDLDTLMGFYRAGRDDGSFDAGIQLALERVLISPDFLFRMERDPTDIAPATAYPLGGLELASRLSFFLWSSGPDDELLELAEQGRLDDPVVFEQQTRRMLADPRASQLVRNFAGQWLFVRAVDRIDPEYGLFPQFDEELRAAMRSETESFFHAFLREDRPAVDMFDADFTFVNARLARHYGLPEPEGSGFARVDVGGTVREGLLTQAGPLSVTSRRTRTSLVKRGWWVLKQLLCNDPPPAPAPANLGDDEEGGGGLRERLERHRQDPACAVCHTAMDPIGFALEVFDPIGGWRNTDGQGPIDARGEMPDGTPINGPLELAAQLKRDPRAADCIQRQMFTYAMGRGPTSADDCAMRGIRDDWRSGGGSLGGLVRAITSSAPFTRRIEEVGP